MQIENRPDRRSISRLTLQVTDACNLQCVYCFTGDKGCAEKFVSEEDFGYFLGFCLRNGMRGIRLTGGETMLHPHVHRFVHLAVQVGLPVHIFSNFTLTDCLQGLNVPGKSLSFLINVNDRDVYDTNTWGNLTRNLGMAAGSGYSTVLGYTVHTVPFKIPHIMQLAEVYRIQKIRISPAKPTIGADNRWLKPEEMRLFAESTMQLHQALQSVGKQLVLDCPVPFCHLPQEYLPFFMQELKLSGTCGFGTSVNVNLEVGHCYVTNSLLAKRTLHTFADVSEMAEYAHGLVKELDARYPHAPECRDCRFAVQGLCDGGCYGTRQRAISGQDVING